MKNLLRQAMEYRGLTPNSVSKLGIPYQTVYKHFYGDREVSPEYAIKYEALAGIPRSEIRPDIWPVHTMTESHEERNDNVAQGV